MYLPDLINVRTAQEVTDIFFGYSANNAGAGYFKDTKNLTSDNFPVMSQRDIRTHIRNIDKPNGMYASDGIAWADGTKLFYNGLEIDVTLEDSEKTFVRMGAYLCIFPDKIVYNTKTDEIINMENSYTTIGDVTFEPCDADGASITYLSNTDVEDPLYTPTDGDYWLKDGSALMRYSAILSMWQPVPTAYIRIKETIDNVDNVHFNDGFKKGDVVEFTCETLSQFNGTFTLYDVSDDGIYMIIAGVSDQVIIGAPDTLMIARTVPDMDYVCEQDNRLWGCSSENHEIYACKLGDPTNWRTYLGLANDAYAVTVGSPGDFTGCISHRGYVLFFKEECIHKIYGSMPSNYQIMDVKYRGVEKGSEKSLCIINEVLYYKARDCVCAFDGSISGSISDALGNAIYHDAAAGKCRDRYIINMADEKYVRYTFTYDTEKNIWMKLDEENIKAFANDSGALYFMTDKAIKLVQKEYATEMIFPSSNILHTYEGETEYTELYPGLTDPAIYPSSGNTGVSEGDVSWMATTHDIGMEYTGSKYVSRIVLRLSCEKEFNVDVMYDSDGIWENILKVTGTGKKSVSIPVRLRRCDHCALKFYGTGDVKLYSMAKTIESGGLT